MMMIKALYTHTYCITYTRDKVSCIGKLWVDFHGCCGWNLVWIWCGYIEWLLLVKRKHINNVCIKYMANGVKRLWIPWTFYLWWNMRNACGWWWWQFLMTRVQISLFGRWVESWVEWTNRLLWLYWVCQEYISFKSLVTLLIYSNHEWCDEDMQTICISMRKHEKGWLDRIKVWFMIHYNCIFLNAWNFEHRRHFDFWSKTFE